MSIEELYQELILDHAKNPCCRGELENADAKAVLFNPLCGDQVQVALRTSAGAVEALRFDGKGCSISQASASMMADLCSGKSVSEVHKILATFSAMMGSKDAVAGPGVDLGDAKTLEGVRRFPARIRCAMLAWEALSQCLRQLEVEEV